MPMRQHHTKQTLLSEMVRCTWKNLFKNHDISKFKLRVINMATPAIYRKEIVLSKEDIKSCWRKHLHLSLQMNFVKKWEKLPLKLLNTSDMKESVALSF